MKNNRLVSKTSSTVAAEGISGRLLLLLMLLLATWRTRRKAF
jgi:hypothetical protein